MENVIEAFIDANREKLKDFASSLLFSSWANLAVQDGMDAEKVFYYIMKYNIIGKDRII